MVARLVPEVVPRAHLTIEGNSGPSDNSKGTRTSRKSRAGNRDRDKIGTKDSRCRGEGGSRKRSSNKHDGG